MKCVNCGFVSSKEFYRCPYCGHVHSDDRNIFNRSISISKNTSIRVKSVIMLILFNLFGLCFLLDWYLGFKFFLTFISYVVLMGLFVALQIASRKRKFFATLIAMDFYMIGGMLLAWLYFPMPELQQAITFIPTFVLPGYILLVSIVSPMAIIMKHDEKRIRPIWLEFDLLMHFVIAVILFIFLLVCKHHLGDDPIPFGFMAFGATPENYTAAFRAEEVLIFLSFGVSLLYLINYNVSLVTHIFNQVKGFYGKPRD